MSTLYFSPLDTGLMTSSRKKIILYASVYGRPMQYDFPDLDQAVSFAIDGLSERRITPLRIIDREGRVLLDGESIRQYAHAHGL